MVRTYGPMFEIPQKTVLAFLTLNRNKRSIALDLKTV